jgi:hypothetical protein
MLGLVKSNSKSEEGYLHFIQTWMEVFFLSLNGYLEHPTERRGRLSEWNTEDSWE